VQGEYFNNDSLKGDRALLRTGQQIDFHWGDGSSTDGGPLDHFSARWTGYFIPRTEDDYKFWGWKP
jgi:alpha-L-fucosidase